MKKKCKIFIVSCYGYFGGIIVLDKLCAELRKLGYDARVIKVLYFPNEYVNPDTYKKSVTVFHLKLFIKKVIIKLFPFLGLDKISSFSFFLNQPIEGIKYQFLPNITDDDIVIYPEVIYGNPLGAKNVVRWLLYHYRYEQDKNAYSDSDLFICFRRIFNSPALNPDCKIVRQYHFDDKLYRQYNFGERMGNCYILRKGRTRNDLPEHFDGPVYDNDMTQEELVEMFNTHKYCYIYDTQTFYTYIAAVCGCIPIVVMESGKTFEDYFTEDERNYSIYGIAYGDSPEQIQYAINTREKLLQLLDFPRTNHENALKMVDYLEDFFVDK